MFFGNVIHRNRILLAPEGDGKGGGGGGDDVKKEIEALKEQNKKLTEQFEKLSKGKKSKHKNEEQDDESDDDDEEEEEDEEEELHTKVKKNKSKKDQEKTDSAALESALRFDLQSAEFIKNNESVLPKDVADIFEVSKKENYKSPVQKASAIKSAIIQTFFKLQTNVDSLTSNQKNSLDDYLKLTKDGKEERAQQVFENILEPTLEMLKRVKKAEEVAKAKSGHANQSDATKAHNERMMKLSRKHYLGEKSDA